MATSWVFKILLVWQGYVMGVAEPVENVFATREACEQERVRITSQYSYYSQYGMVVLISDCYGVAKARHQ